MEEIKSIAGTKIFEITTDTNTDKSSTKTVFATGTGINNSRFKRYRATFQGAKVDLNGNFFFKGSL